MDRDIPQIHVYHGNTPLISALNLHSAEFLIIGGVAVRHYGCRGLFEVADLDLLIRPTIANGSAVISALLPLNFVPSWTAEDFLIPGLQLPLKNRDYFAELHTPREGFDFLTLYENGSDIMLNGQRTKIISKSDLILLKRLAVEQTTEALSKHQRDLDCLAVT